MIKSPTLYETSGGRIRWRRRKEMKIFWRFYRLCERLIKNLFLLKTDRVDIRKVILKFTAISFYSRCRPRKVTTRRRKLVFGVKKSLHEWKFVALDSFTVVVCDLDFWFVFSFGGCQEVSSSVSLEPLCVNTQHDENVHKGSYKKTYENKFYQHFYSNERKYYFKLIFLSSSRGHPWRDRSLV